MKKPTTRTRKPRIAHAGTRRSEKIVDPKEVAPVETGVAFRGLENEDPRFPGWRTVIVPRDDPRDAMHMSPIGAYEGMDYEILSEETKYTNHAGHVLMGIPVEKYNEREHKRVWEHNNRVVEGFGDKSLESSNGQGDPLKFINEKSGLKIGSRSIPVHQQVQQLRNMTGSR